MTRKHSSQRTEAKGARPPVQADVHGAARGRKHRCAACGAAFYDLERKLSACPKCATPYATAPLMRSGEPARKRPPWSRSGRRVEPSIEAEAPVPSNEDDGGVPLLDEENATAEESQGNDDAAEDGNADAAPEREDPDPERA